MGSCAYCNRYISGNSLVNIGAGAYMFCDEVCFNMREPKQDSINPSHYKSHPSGIECIQITEHMSFTLGNCLKYIWRADLKHDDGGIEDLKKAQWYINRELDKRQSR